MTYVPLNSTDNGSTSRGVINANFASLDVTDALKVEYSGTVPADGDLIVASGITGKVIKKKVFTPSQVLESDVNGQPTSAAKGTAYNKNFGTGATDVPAGNSVVLLTTDQTVAGVKTFSSSPVLPTPSPGDNSTKGATTAYADAAVAAAVATSYKNGNTTYDLSTASGTQNIAHGGGKSPKYVRVKGRILAAVNPPLYCEAVYNGTTQTSNSLYKNGNPSYTGETNFRIGNGTDATTYQTGTITYDATNIIISWTKTGSPTGTLDIFWEAYF